MAKYKGIQIELMDQVSLCGHQVRYHEQNGVVYLVQDDISKKILGEYSNKNFFDVCKSRGGRAVYVDELSTKSNPATSAVVDIISALEFIGTMQALDAIRELRSWNYKVPRQTTPTLPVPQAAATNQPFFFDNHQIRTVVKDGEPWFVAKDVAEVLGYADTDKAVRTHCKYPVLFKPAEMAGLESGPRGTMCIRENDVYRLVMKSKLPSAERFEEWVVGEVLPTIRKTGSYTAPVQSMDPEKLKLAEAMLIAHKTIEELQPKAEVYDEFISSADGINLTDLAKTFGMTAQALGTYLRGAEVLCATRTAVRPRHEYVEAGWFTPARKRYVYDEGTEFERVVYTPLHLFTPLGQLGVRSMLIEDGLVERKAA